MQPIAANNEAKSLSGTIGKCHVHALVILFQSLQHMVPLDFYAAFLCELIESLKEHRLPQAGQGISVGLALLLGVMANLQAAEVGLILGNRRVEMPLFLDVTSKVIKQPGYLRQYIKPITLDAIKIQRLLAYLGLTHSDPKR
jgi:hypothetical protein